jgi:hypothetical protein
MRLLGISVFDALVFWENYTKICVPRPEPRGSERCAILYLFGLLFNRRRSWVYQTFDAPIQSTTQAAIWSAFDAYGRGTLVGEALDTTTPHLLLHDAKIDRSPSIGPR